MDTVHLWDREWGWEGEERGKGDDGEGLLMTQIVLMCSPIQREKHTLENMC